MAPFFIELSKWAIVIGFLLFNLETVDRLLPLIHWKDKAFEAKITGFGINKLVIDIVIQ